MSRFEAYKKALISQNIPDDLAEKCAQILVNDDISNRTKQQQQTIDKAFAIAHNLPHNWRQND
jgi:hypothetical protein